MTENDLDRIVFKSMAWDFYIILILSGADASCPEVVSLLVFSFSACFVDDELHVDVACIALRQQRETMH